MSLLDTISTLFKQMIRLPSLKPSLNHGLKDLNHTICSHIDFHSKDQMKDFKLQIDWNIKFDFGVLIGHGTSRGWFDNLCPFTNVAFNQVLYM